MCVFFVLREPGDRAPAERSCGSSFAPTEDSVQEGGRHGEHPDAEAAVADVHEVAAFLVAISGVVGNRDSLAGTGSHLSMQRTIRVH